MNEEKIIESNLTIPERIRSIAYLVGMIGVPAILAGYILIVLSGKVDNIGKQVSQLGTRIDERPMGLDKTSDFIIYVTFSMETELLEGLPDLIDTLDLTSKPEDKVIAKKLAFIDESFEAYIRPIVRKHKRFAERFPSIGGNLGAIFSVSAPAEDIGEGNIDAHLMGTTHKDFAETICALISNRIQVFGHPMITEADETPGEPDILLIDSSELLTLCQRAIESSTVGLRDQMLERVRQQGTELETE